VRRRLDDRARALCRVARFEDPRADEGRRRSELHAERRVRRDRNPPAVKVTTGSFPFSATHGRARAAAQLLRLGVKLLDPERLEAADAAETPRMW